MRSKMGGRDTFLQPVGAKKRLSGNRPLPVVRTGLILTICWLLISAAGATEWTIPYLPSEADYPLLEESLEQALAAEQERLAAIESIRRDLVDSQPAFEEWLHTFKLRLSTFRNFLVLPEYDEYEVRKTGIRIQAALNHISGRENRGSETLIELEQIGQSIQNRQNTFEQEKKFLQRRPEPISTDSAYLRQHLDTILDLLAEQRSHLTYIKDIYHQRLDRLKSLRRNYETVFEQFEEREARLDRQWFVKKTPDPLSRLDDVRLKTEAARLAGELSVLFRVFDWQSHTVPDRQQYNLFVVTFLLLLAALAAVLVFYHRLLRKLRDDSWENGYFWRYLTIRMVRRTLLMGGFILFVHFYPVPPEYRITPFFMFMALVKNVFLVLLPVRWGINFLRVMALNPEPFLPGLPVGYLKGLLYGLLVFGVVQVVLTWGLGSDALLAGLWRLAMEAGLLLWNLFFWSRFLRQTETSGPEASGLETSGPEASGLETSGSETFGSETSGSEAAGPEASIWTAAMKLFLPIVAYAVALTALFLELFSFGLLAQFWLQSWAQTAVVLLWAGILFMMLKETETSPTGPLFEETTEEDEDTDEEKATPVRWLVVRLSRILLVIGLVVAVPLAWGGRKPVLMDLLQAINYQISMGKFEISLLDIFAVVIFLIVLHTAAALWKSLLREKFLAEQELEPGLQDSIITISGYLIWLVGLLIALRIIGISAAALTVVFGAVGLGLGFGLQTIFNNFVSGIIILFERPIKVGDTIEINGIWGTVKKINIRSTQVRTYDNADLIIPNSDFVNQQLTNWSFKDARVRRTIRVHVAHGSDTQLVKETLFNIAYSHPQVYKRPHPEVLFDDFGDSALVFKLRLWASIQYFLSVETDVRLEIDRQFRELGIIIPFPQRDVYLRDKVRPTGEEEEPDRNSGPFPGDNGSV